MSSGETPARVVERAPAGGAPVSATPVQVSPPSGPDLATLVMVVLGVVVVAALYLGREVLIPITLAILLSFVLGRSLACFAGCTCPGCRLCCSRSCSRSALLRLLVAL
jgi:predicted PurR-regulated permease PerM